MIFIHLNIMKTLLLTTLIAITTLATAQDNLLGSKKLEVLSYFRDLDQKWELTSRKKSTDGPSYTAYITKEDNPEGPVGISFVTDKSDEIIILVSYHYPSDLFEKVVAGIELNFVKIGQKKWISQSRTGVITLDTDDLTAPARMFTVTFKILR